MARRRASARAATSRRRCGTALVVFGVATTSASARATSFDVFELHAGYELHRGDGGHASYGAGYTWDVFLTAPPPIPRGFLLGARADLLHCPDCRSKVDGGALFLPILATWWKEDLSTLSFYVGLAPGLGYSRESEKVFGVIELQTALQWRALYEGFWIRPIVYASAGGAYDGYTALGLRIAVGFSPNHGRRGPDDDTIAPQPRPSTCNPPAEVEADAADETWVLPSCYRDEVAVRVDGRAVSVHASGRDLVIVVGRGPAGKVQRIELDIAGGTFEIDLRRR